MTIKKTPTKKAQVKKVSGQKEEFMTSNEDQQKIIDLQIRLLETQLGHFDSMNTRFFAATSALQGLLAKGMQAETASQKAVQVADALLKRLEETE